MTFSPEARLSTASGGPRPCCRAAADWPCQERMSRAGAPPPPADDAQAAAPSIVASARLRPKRFPSNHGLHLLPTRTIVDPGGRRGSKDGKVPRRRPKKVRWPSAKERHSANVKSSSATFHEVTCEACVS